MKNLFIFLFVFLFGCEVTSSDLSKERNLKRFYEPKFFSRLIVRQNAPYRFGVLVGETEVLDGCRGPSYARYLLDNEGAGIWWEEAYLTGYIYFGGVCPDGFGLYRFWFDVKANYPFLFGSHNRIILEGRTEE